MSKKLCNFHVRMLSMLPVPGFVRRTVRELRLK